MGHADAVGTPGISILGPCIQRCRRSRTLANLQSVRWLRLVLLALVACRGRETSAPAADAFDHRRDDYSSATGVTTAAAAAIVDSLQDASASPGLVRVDERLSVVASELAERSAGGETIEFDEAVAIAREAGSPLFPVLSVAVDPHDVAPPWGAEALAAVPGTGPLAIGLSTIERADRRIVVVFAREFARLPTPVRRHGTVRFEFELHEAGPFAPAVLVVAKDGPRRIPVQAAEEGRWIAERSGGFDDTLVGILGTQKAASPSTYSKRGMTELLASLQFGDLSPLEGDTTSLPAAIARLREQWNRSPLQIATGEATPCGEPVATIADRTVTMRQECVTWRSQGTDADRLRALLVNPLALEMVGDPAWQLAEIRSDPGTTSIRFGRAFEELTADQVHTRLAAVLQHRWPGIAHDTKADASTTALATKWANAPLSDESTSAMALPVGTRAAPGRLDTAAVVYPAQGRPGTRMVTTARPCASSQRPKQTGSMPKAASA